MFTANAALWITMWATVVALEGDNPVVPTTSGDIRGIREDGLTKFLGVPYAASPLGELRFQKPQRHPGWHGVVRNSTEFGANCMQYSAGLASIVEPATAAVHAAQAVSEDCLFVDVYVPDTTSSSLAVMAWIHGGGFSLGSANYGGLTTGENLAKKGNVIDVGMNYRLSIFGFLPLQQDSTPANVAFLDQNFALQWIQDNIEYFGGDPSKVTIFGESAGGRSVSYHMLSPLSDGLFSGAISQSGVFGHELPTQQQQEAAVMQPYAQSVGCSWEDADLLVECLRALPAQVLLQKALEFKFSPYASLDGHFLTDHPKTLLSRGNFQRIPFILSSTSGDGHLDFTRIFGEEAYRNGIMENMTQSATAALIEGDRTLSSGVKTVAQQVVNPFYFASVSGPLEYAQAFLEFLREMLYGSLISWIADYWSTQDIPVFVCEFAQGTKTWAVSNVAFPMGTLHQEDLIFVFGKTDQVEPLDGTTKEELAELSDSIITAWTVFAKGEKPFFRDENNAVHEWPTFESTARKYLKWNLHMTNESVASPLEPRAHSLWNELIPSLVAQQCNDECPYVVTSTHEPCSNGLEPDKGILPFLDLDKNGYKAIIVFLVALIIMLVVMTIAACIHCLRSRAKLRKLKKHKPRLNVSGFD